MCKLRILEDSVHLRSNAITSGHLNLNQKTLTEVEGKHRIDGLFESCSRWNQSAVYFRHLSRVVLIVGLHDVQPRRNQTRFGDATRLIVEFSVSEF